MTHTGARPPGCTRPRSSCPSRVSCRRFDGATGWLNSPPLTPAGLRGKVVLADFWTYTCINWLRQLPYVRAWAGEYAGQGLVVVGVHTPEFPFEHNVDNVRQAVQDMRIEYPVAIDNDYAVWGAFGNHYWPALYFADAQGRIRHHHFGEGEYQQSEMVIQQLLAEAGSAGAGQTWCRSTHAAWKPRPTGPRCDRRKTTPAMSAPRTSPPPAAPCQASRTSIPPPRSWGSITGPCPGTGRWRTRPPRSTRAAGGIVCRFHARDLNLVMGPAAAGSSVPFRVLIDGQPPGDAHGTDVDDQGHGTLTGQRVYQLVRQPGPIISRTFEITFLGPGAQAYSFTFG